MVLFVRPRVSEAVGRGAGRLGATFRSSESGVRAGIAALPLEDGFPEDRLFPGENLPDPTCQLGPC